jgi:diaminohydroxyphosphoribosylaminopyrimidine deaminase/5-amino-6-(5-phosphoribosylamino)uracil reductase
MQRRSGAEDIQFMARAVTLASRGKGTTRPNPPVGAVVVKNGQVLGEGWHRKAGGDHAEIIALKKAGVAAKGSTLYVTLEPCSTTGRTGPCTQAIIAAKIKRVVVGSTDPNSKHKARGYRVLRAAGIDVCHGVLSQATNELIAPFTKWMATGRPYITLKMAMSLDGKITDKDGRSQWISCEQSRKAVRQLRGKVDAVMVGSGTVLADNPSLYPIGAGKRQPYRIAVDTKGRTPLDSNLLSDDHVDKTTMVIGSSCSRKKEELYLAQGATVIRAKERGGHVALSDMMKRLGKMNILHVLCEGGAVLAGALAAQNLVDEYHIYSAPVILGDGKRNLPVIAKQEWGLSKCPRLEVQEVSMSGDDIFTRCRPAGRS